ncbi:MAG: sulfur carrier protein ThiS [Phycisphaerales bacterium]|nr:sulfur carrier protein ThiS [Phycisphaerales bacterium]
MRIVVNGGEIEVPTDSSVQALLASRGLAERPCAVEVNKEVVPRRGHADLVLCDGDVIEIVTLVGGG